MRFAHFFCRYRWTSGGDAAWRQLRSGPDHTTRQHHPRNRESAKVSSLVNRASWQKERIEKKKRKRKSNVSTGRDGRLERTRQSTVAVSKRNSEWSPDIGGDRSIFNLTRSLSRGARIRVVCRVSGSNDARRENHIVRTKCSASCSREERVVTWRTIFGARTFLIGKKKISLRLPFSFALESSCWMRDLGEKRRDYPRYSANRREFAKETLSLSRARTHLYLFIYFFFSFLLLSNPRVLNVAQRVRSDNVDSFCGDKEISFILRISLRELR